MLSTLAALISRRRVVLPVDHTPAGRAAQFTDVVMDHPQVANPDYTRAHGPTYVIGKWRPRHARMPRPTTQVTLLSRTTLHTVIPSLVVRTYLIKLE